jgi:alpha-tubulin suppressor-like RCC1 family protein
VLKAGAVWCWGVGSNGQLGDGTTTTSAAPVQVKGLSGVKSLVTDYESAYCALLISGHVECWGDNATSGGSTNGQLGGGGNELVSTTPVMVKGLSNALSVVGGTDGFCAVLRNGQAMCWGDNSAFQLGNDSGVAYAPAPVGVKGLSDVVAIASSYYSYCALLKNGTAECWGSNGGADSYGALGNGNSEENYQSLHVVTVKGLSGAVNLLGETGDGGYCGLLHTGNARCWGTGLLGNGSSGSSAVPVAVKGLSNIESLVSDFDSDSVCALLKNGSADCWGAGYGGALGDGAVASANAPAAVVGLG